MTQLSVSKQDFDHSIDIHNLKNDINGGDRQPKMSSDENFYSDVKQLVNDHINSVFNKLFTDQLEFINQIESISGTGKEENGNRIEVFESLKKRKSQILSLVKKHYKLKGQMDFDQGFSRFNENLTGKINHLNAFEIKEQSHERFNIGEGDGLLLRVLKRFKKVFFYMSRAHRYFLNLFRKEPLPITYWTHRIPLRNLAKWYYMHELSWHLNPIARNTHLVLTQSWLNVWKAEEAKDSALISYKREGEKIDPASVQQAQSFEEIKQSLHKAKEKVIEEIAIALERSRDKFLLACEKVGTIELGASNFSKGNFDSSNKKLNKKFTELNKGWQNTFFALADDWKLNLELFYAKYDSQLSFLRSGEQYTKKLDEKILPQLDRVEQLIDQVLQNLNGFKGKENDLLKVLHIENAGVKRSLDQDLIPEVYENILNENLPGLINRIEEDIRRQVDRLSDERALVKTQVYNEPLKSSEISYISPRDLMAHEALPSLIRVTNQVKKDLFNQIEELRKEITDLDNIVQFSLESGIIGIKEDKKSVDVALDEVKEGVERAIARTREIKEDFKKTGEEADNKISEAVKAFTGELESLTSNENVLEIRLRIAAGKALHRTGNVVTQFAERVGRGYRRLLSRVGKVAGVVRKYYTKVKNRFSLRPHKGVVPTEVSLFLHNAHTATEKLPLIYQRLFKIQPLRDMSLFEGRDKELEQIRRSYEAWNNGRYATTVIVGEKWCGMTTMISYFISTLENPIPHFRLNSLVNIYTEKDFLNFLGASFDKTFNSIEEVIKHLNDQDKCIVALEDLQNLYLRKVNGFKCVEQLYELMSRTQHNVFWIISSTIYTWEYLSKTIRIVDYFEYIVKVDDLNDEQMIKLISKRNRISGYELLFEPSEVELQSKKFRKLSAEEQQMYLRENFFKNLNRFARSNVSLALLYWLLSTNEITEDSISISSFSEPDLSFILGLSRPKVFILYALVMHDGLSEKDVSIIFNQSIAQSRQMLLLLLEDGILIIKNEVYYVNPLLYRQTVRLLKAKNLIH